MSRHAAGPAKAVVSPLRSPRIAVRLREDSGSPAARKSARTTGSSVRDARPLRVIQKARHCWLRDRVEMPDEARGRSLQKKSELARFTAVSSSCEGRSGVSSFPDLTFVESRKDS